MPGEKYDAVYVDSRFWAHEPMGPASTVALKAPRGGPMGPTGSPRDPTVRLWDPSLGSHGTPPWDPMSPPMDRIGDYLLIKCLSHASFLTYLNGAVCNV